MSCKYLLKTGTTIERFHFGEVEWQYFVTTKTAVYDNNEMHPSQDRKEWMLIYLPDQAYPYIVMRVRKIDLVPIKDVNTITENTDNSGVVINSMLWKDDHWY